MKKILVLVLCMSMLLAGCTKQNTDAYTVLEWYEMLAMNLGHSNQEDDRLWFENLNLDKDENVTYEIAYVSLARALNLKEDEITLEKLKNHPQGSLIQALVNLCKFENFDLDEILSKEEAQNLLNTALLAMRDFSFIDQSYRYTFKQEPKMTDFPFNSSEKTHCSLEDGLYSQGDTFYVVENHTYRKAEFEDIFEDFECHGTFSPNLQEGIKLPSEATNISKQGYYSHQFEVKQLSALPFSFELKGYKVSGSVSKNNVDVRIRGKVKNMDLDETFSLNDLKITTDITFNPLGKQRILLRADYDAHNHISLSKELKKDMDFSIADLNELKKRLAGVQNQDDTLEEIDIASFSFKVPWTAHTVTVDLDLKLSFSLNGEVGLIIDAKQSHGVNVEHFRLNKIQFQDIVCNPYIEGNMEGCIGMGLGMSVLNCSLVDFVAESGLGATCKSQIHLVDTKAKVVSKMEMDKSLTDVNEVLNEFEDHHECFVDTCVDVDTYWLVRFRAGSSKTLVHKLGLSGKFTPVKKKLNIYHFENRLPVLSCTRQYSFIESENLQTDTMISDVNLTMKIGETKKLILKSQEQIIPATYTSNNEKVATVDQFGNVKAISKGLAIIEAKTSDGQTYYCKVYVPLNHEVEFTPLNSAFFWYEYKR